MASQPPKSDTPTSIKYIAFATFVLGILTILFGLLEYFDITTLYESLTEPLNDKIIFTSLLVILGVIIVIVGFGLLKTLNYAFFIFLGIYALVMALMLFIFPDFTGTKIILAIVAFMIGDILAEHEYFFREGGIWEKPPTIFKYLSFVQIILGIIVIIVGALIFAEIEVPFFDFETWLQGVSSMLEYDSGSYGIILIIVGIILLIAGFALYKTIWVALYLYIIAAIIIIVFIFLITPVELNFYFTAVIIIFASILAGDIVAENEVFFD